MGGKAQAEGMTKIETKRDRSKRRKETVDGITL
jgi:hypothetical protein